MKALNIPLTEFLRPFFEPSDKICLRIFDDRKAGSIFKGMKVETSLAKVDAMTEDLKKHNAQNRGIYFVVNHGGHEDTDITRVNAQYMECDDLSLEEQLARVAGLVPETWAAPLSGPELGYRRRARIAVRWDASRKRFTS